MNIVSTTWAMMILCVCDAAIVVKRWLAEWKMSWFFGARPSFEHNRQIEWITLRIQVFFGPQYIWYDTRIQKSASLHYVISYVSWNLKQGYKVLGLICIYEFCLNVLFKSFYGCFSYWEFFIFDRSKVDTLHEWEVVRANALPS